MPGKETAMTNYYIIQSAEEYARIHPEPLIAAAHNGRCGMLAELLFSHRRFTLAQIQACLETLLLRDDQPVDDDTSKHPVNSDPAFSVVLCYLRKEITGKQLLVQGHTIVTSDGAQQLDMQALCDRIRTQDAFFYDHWITQIRQTLTIPDRFSLQLALTSHIDHTNADIASFLICYHLPADSTVQQLEEEEREQRFYFHIRRNLEELRHHVGCTIFNQFFPDHCSGAEIRLCRGFIKACLDAKDSDTLAYYTNKLSCLMRENILLFPHTAYRQIVGKE